MQPFDGIDKQEALRPLVPKQEIIKDQDELELEKLLKQTFLDEILSALYDSRYIAPIVALIAIFLAYHLTIAPHQVYTDKSAILNMNLADVRPVLDATKQAEVQRRLLFGETYMQLPSPRDDLIHFKFHQFAGGNGHYRLPSMFYTGVTFSLTWQNPHNIYFTAKNKFGYKELKHDLLGLFPKPTSLMKRAATYMNNTEDIEDGLAVFFSYEDLEKQGKLSSDKLQPWKRILDPILDVARKHHQVYVVVWYPSQFGSDQHEDENDKYKHFSMIQQVIPTRTGLDGIKSTAAVWMTAVNQTEPQNFDVVRTKDW